MSLLVTSPHQANLAPLRFKQMDGSCEECDGQSTVLPIVAVCILAVTVLGVVVFYVNAGGSAFAL